MTHLDEEVNRLAPSGPDVSGATAAARRAGSDEEERLEWDDRR
jgi:hypothetical protein